MQFQSFDEEYLRKLKEGDTAVEAHFAQYFGELIYLKLRRRLCSRQLLEDIRQETLSRVLTAIREHNDLEDARKFGAFVSGVCHYVTVEFLREAERGRQKLGDHDVEDREPKVKEFSERNLAYRVLGDLPERDSDLLEKILFKGVTEGELCRQYQVDARYLRLLLRRAKARFRSAYIERQNLRIANYS